MASIESIITLLFVIIVSIDSFAVGHNHKVSSTPEPDPPSIPIPSEGFGDFHYPEDPEDIERSHHEDHKHEFEDIDKDHQNIKPNESKVETSPHSPDSDGSLNSFDNSTNTRFYTGFDGDLRTEEEGCYCHDRIEVFCRCFGESVTQIPSNLTLGLTKLSMISLGMEVLKLGTFQVYDNLTDLYMESMKKLRLIESGVFLNLTHLRAVYIKFAPLLTHIPDGVFLGTFPKLRVLRIVQTGLEKLPALNYFTTHGIITMMDFDSNRIRNLTSHSIIVKAEIMNIEYNMIESVQNWAFHGSEIAKLSLKGNKNLVHLQEKAFEGLKSLRELDLSETSINKLPTLGFDTLETLKVENTFTLKEIPSVMNFKSIRTAFLTYPYHCCAFKFPATHNPKEFARYQDMFKKDMEKRYCIDTSTTPDPTLERNRRNLDEEAFLASLYYDTKERASKLVNRLLDMFTSENTDQNDENSYSNPYYFQSRHLNEFGQILSTGTRSPHEVGTVYGRVIYKPDDVNQTEGVSSVMVLKEISLQQDGPTKSKTTPTFIPNLGFGPKFDNNENEGIDRNDHSKKDPKHQPPGKFGTPYTSIGPKQEFCGDIAQNYPNVKCYPIPDAFNPCEDVMGNSFLRILVWIVVIAAVLGNSAVMIVLMSGRFTFNVSKFLMINLAIADLMMGVYLLIIAVVDLRTVGVYFNYAIDWQHGAGCKIAGFITVFASELSIFTLTVITLERWFAITFAIQLNKRLKLGLAVKVMIGGWIYALLMASLPLMGISAYSKTSICLPMENKEVGDVAYLISLLTINGLAFVLISACYAKMYCSIISQQTRATVNDMTIAKRMALLVFTDFVCWAPIAFFGLTAIAGFPLINVPKSKFLLVTFYPLNSCANPFLYAILTKQYRRDFFILASRYGFCTKRAMKYKNASSHGHLRIAAVRSNNAAISGSIFSQVSCDGQVKHHYKYICRGHGHHHGYQDDNSCRSAVFSTVDIYPEFSSRSNSRSNDSTHEIVKIGHKTGLSNGETHRKKVKKDKHRKHSMDVMSSEDESTSSTLHKGSPHPVRNSHTKLNRLPSGEQQEILKRALQMDKTKCCVTCAHTNSCRRKCSTCIQRDSSSGEKSVVDYDSELLRWTKTSRASKCPVENQSFVMSSHSNSAAEDTEI